MYPKLSLVFPCWHAAQHMQHVLEDLKAQTFPDFEAILVNDGDDSQNEVMEQIAAQDRRIHIIRIQQNSGVAVARNAGTDAATTEWVTYPDPDDRFGPNYVRSLYEAVDGTGVEMACGGRTTFFVKTKLYTHQYIKIDNCIEVMDMALGYEHILSSYVQGAPWNKLYNIEIMRKNGLSQDRKFLNKQDYAFNLKYYPYVKKVGLIKDCDYIYYSYDEGNNSKRYNPHLINNLYEIVNMSEQFHRLLKWPEKRIVDCKNTDLSYFGLIILENLFAFDSPLSLNDVSKKIQAELLEQPEIVNAILKKDFRKDRIQKLIQRLVRFGNARLLALTFKILVIGKRRFGVLYKITKSYFRGE